MPNSNNSKPKFLVDFMLGRLCRWLRIFGYDSEYVTEKDRLTAILKSLKENRILLTRDHRLSSKRAWKLFLITSDHIRDQVKEIIGEFGITILKENLFSRCSVCNAPIAAVSKETVKNLVPGYVYDTQNEFSKCPVCGKIYWPGTHFDLLLKDMKKAGIKVVTK